MNKGEPRLSTLTNTNKAKIFSVSGYGKTRPLTKDYRKKSMNRRIDIRIAMTPPSLNNRPKLIKGLEKSTSNKGN